MYLVFIEIGSFFRYLQGILNIMLETRIDISAHLRAMW